MAYSSASYPGSSTSMVTKANIDTFVPEIWSDEIVAAYMKKLVMANLVKKLKVKGKKGDVVHIPMPNRGFAYAKTAAVAVTIQAQDESEKTVTINQHFEYSRFIEDIAEIQGLSSFRKFYTEDAGYALARKVDSALIELGRQTNGSTVTTAVYANGYIGSDGTTAYTSASPNAAALTDAAIRRTIQRLDDADCDMGDRYLVIPPSGRNTMMGLSRFTEQAFVGEVGSGNTIRNGKIGDVYGIEVFVSSNCDTALGTGSPRVALMFHKDSMCLAEQLAPRVQTQYKQEYLSTLLTADTLYGTQILRNNSTAGSANQSTAFALVIPA